jgi:hypothetical protein
VTAVCVMTEDQRRERARAAVADAIRGAGYVVSDSALEDFTSEVERLQRESQFCQVQTTSAIGTYKCRLEEGHEGSHRDGSAHWVMRDELMDPTTDRDAIGYLCMLARWDANGRESALIDKCEAYLRAMLQTSETTGGKL